MGQAVLTYRHTMNAPTPNSISVTTNPTFWEVYIASLVLIRYSWPQLILYSFFPLFGLFIFVAPFAVGERPNAGEILLALFGFFFIPLRTAFAVRSARRRNKLAQGPFTYSFDSEGVHTTGPVSNQTISWAGILRVRRSRRFLFIFIAPTRAHCIPLREINDPRFIDDLRGIAAGRTDFRA